MHEQAYPPTERHGSLFGLVDCPGPIVDGLCQECGFDPQRPYVASLVEAGPDRIVLVGVLGFDDRAQASIIADCDRAGMDLEPELCDACRRVDAFGTDQPGRVKITVERLPEK